MRKSKKFTALLLTAIMAISTITVLPFTASAAVDANGRYYPDENLECGTSRKYLYIPESLSANDHIYDLRAYWWSGTDIPDWPGVYMQVDPEIDRLFYIDLPADVEVVIFNSSSFEGREDLADYVFVQQATVYCGSFFEDEVHNDTPVGEFGDDIYIPYHETQAFFDEVRSYINSGNTEALGNFADNFYYSKYNGFGYSYDNMICFIDTNTIHVGNYDGIDRYEYYNGFWFFYYGDGKYGTRLTPEAAEAAGELYSLVDTPEITKPSSETTEPSSETEPTSKTAEPSTDDEPTPDYKFGDVDLDGVVNVKDATLIQRIAVEDSSVDVDDTQRALADVDGDNEVNVKDATCVLLYSVESTTGTGKAGQPYILS